MANTLRADVILMTQMKTAGNAQYISSVKKTYADAEKQANAVLKKQVESHRRHYGDMDRQTREALKKQTQYHEDSVFTIEGLYYRISASLSSLYIKLKKDTWDAIHEIISQFEKYRESAYLVVGGMEQLSSITNDIQYVTGLAAREVVDATKAMVSSGLAAQLTTKQFKELTQVNAQFVRITGASIRSLTIMERASRAIGMSFKENVALLNKSIYVSNKYGITGSQLSGIFANLSRQLISVKGAYGAKAAREYADALLTLSASAKQAGVDISTAAELMRSLTEDPMKYIVALGSSALYATPAENLKKLTAQIEQIEDHLMSFPPGLRASMARSIYGLTFEQIKLLKSQKEVTEAIKRGYTSLGDPVKDIGLAFRYVMSGIESSREAMSSMYHAFLKQVIEPVVELAKIAGERFSQISRQLVEGFREVFSGNGAAFGIKDWVKFIREDVAVYLNKFFDWLSGQIQRLIIWMKSDAFQEWFKSVKKGVVDVYKWVMKLVGAVWNYFASGGATKDLNAFVNILKSIWGWIKTIWGAFKVLIEVTKVALGIFLLFTIDIWGPIVIGIMAAYGAFKLLWEGIKLVWGIMNWLADITIFVIGKIAEAVEWVGGRFAKSAEILWEKLQPVREVFGDIFGIINKGAKLAVLGIKLIADNVTVLYKMMTNQLRYYILSIKEEYYKIKAFFGSGNAAIRLKAVQRQKIHLDTELSNLKFDMSALHEKQQINELKKANKHLQNTEKHTEKTAEETEKANKKAFGTPEEKRKGIGILSKEQWIAQNAWQLAGLNAEKEYEKMVNKYKSLGYDYYIIGEQAKVQQAKIAEITKKQPISEAATEHEVTKKAQEREEKRAESEAVAKTTADAVANAVDPSLKRIYELLERYLPELVDEISTPGHFKSMKLGMYS